MTEPCSTPRLRPQPGRRARPKQTARHKRTTQQAPRKQTSPPPPPNKTPARPSPPPHTHVNVCEEVCKWGGAVLVQVYVAPGAPLKHVHRGAGADGQVVDVLGPQGHPARGERGVGGLGGGGWVVGGWGGEGVYQRTHCTEGVEARWCIDQQASQCTGMPACANAHCTASAGAAGGGAGGPPGDLVGLGGGEAQRMVPVLGVLPGAGHPARRRHVHHHICRAGGRRGATAEQAEGPARAGQGHQGRKLPLDSKASVPYILQSTTAQACAWHGSRPFPRCSGLSLHRTVAAPHLRWWSGRPS